MAHRVELRPPLELFAQEALLFGPMVRDRGKPGMTWFETENTKNETLGDARY